MIKNFIAEIIHVTKRLKAKDVEVEDRLATSDLNSESINVEKDLTVGNNTVIKKDLTVKGNETVEKNLTVNGTSTLKGNVTAEKDLTVKGNEIVEKDLTVKGNETIEKNLTVNGKTTMKELTVEKIVDNGKVYGDTSEIKELTWDSATNKNAEGSIEKPARVDHTHKIPVPKTLTIKNYNETSSVSYNAKSDQTLKIDYNFTGAAAKDHASTTTNFGVGDKTNYGHVKLTDELTESNKEYGCSDGCAITPKIINTLKQDINNTYAKKTECYGVETFITPKSGSDFLKWSPSRSGLYRIYLIGGGGYGAPGKAVKTSGSPTDSTGLGLGTVVAGYGGSGGDVVEIDLWVKGANVEISDDTSENDITGDGENGSDDATSEGDNIAKITFFSERVIVGYDASNAKYKYWSSDTNGDGVADTVVKKPRSVAISGLENIGEIINKRSCAVGYTTYDAVAGHGEDAFLYKKTDGTYSCGLYKSPDYTVPTCGGTRIFTGSAGNKTLPEKPNNSDSVNSSSKRQDGYNGGVPGKKDVHGVVGILGSNGACIRVTSYSTKDTVTYVTYKGGTGGCLAITDLNGYHGSFKDFDGSKNNFRFPKTAPKDRGGYGYYGGGHGGGGATITTNKAFTGSVEKCMKNAQRESTLNAPCVVIAYLGNKKP